jgi:hypothetical protein
MYVIINLQSMFHAKFVGRFILYLHTESGLPSSSDLLVTAINITAEDNFSIVIMASFYIPQNIP